MDPLRIRAETKGFFTRAEARDIGYDDKAVAYLIRTGVWHRFRRGFYTFTDLWTALTTSGGTGSAVTPCCARLGPPLR